MARYELQKIDVIVHRGQRIETGPVQINDDWPGVFIRGDNAMFYGMALKQLLSRLKDDKDMENLINISPLHGLAELLASCNIKNLRKEDDDRDQA